MARKTRSIWWLLLLSSCLGYQVEPYLELAHRDEQFTAPGGADGYEGQMYTLGMRYVPPVRLDEMQLVSLAPRPTNTPVPVVVEQVGDDLPSEVINNTLEKATYAGAACLLALAVVIYVWRRRPKTKPEKSNG